MEGCEVILEKYFTTTPFDDLGTEKAIQRFVDRAAVELNQEPRAVAAFLSMCIDSLVKEMEENQ